MESWGTGSVLVRWFEQTQDWTRYVTMDRSDFGLFAHGWLTLDVFSNKVTVSRLLRTATENNVFLGHGLGFSMMVRKHKTGTQYGAMDLSDFRLFAHGWITLHVVSKKLIVSRLLRAAAESNGFLGHGLGFSTMVRTNPRLGHGTLPWTSLISDYSPMGGSPFMSCLKERNCFPLTSSRDMDHSSRCHGALWLRTILP